MERPVALLLLFLFAHHASATTTYRPLPPELWPGADVAASVARLSRALQFKTVSVPYGRPPTPTPSTTTTKGDDGGKDAGNESGLADSRGWSPSRACACQSAGAFRSA